MLSFKEIRELIDLVSERGLSGLEIEQAGFRVRIEGHRPADHNGSGALLTAAAAPVPAPVLLPAEPPAEDKTLHVITSPIVGTFYRSPSPESDSFAEVGQKVA